MFFFCDYVRFCHDYFPIRLNLGLIMFINVKGLCIRKSGHRLDDWTSFNSNKLQEDNNYDFLNMISTLLYK